MANYLIQNVSCGFYYLFLSWFEPFENFIML